MSLFEWMAEGVTGNLAKAKKTAKTHMKSGVVERQDCLRAEKKRKRTSISSLVMWLRIPCLDEQSPPFTKSFRQKKKTFSIIFPFFE